VIGLSTCFSGCVGRETEADHVGHLARLRWSREHFSYGAVHLPNPVDDSRKVAIREPRDIRMVEGHTRTERGMCVAY
jgi:hypothetical protein